MYYRIVHGTACRGINFLGGIKMEQELQKVNHHSRLMEWGRKRQIKATMPLRHRGFYLTLT